MATIAHINPRVLRWAAQRAGLSATELAKAMKKDPTVIAKWMDGTATPTFRQARVLAKRVRVPFGYLFLDKPPPDDLPLPDFRRLTASKAPPPTSVDLREVVSDVLRKQEWFREYRRERDEGPIDFVGQFSLEDDAEVVAHNMADRLEFESEVRPESQPDGFLRAFVRRSEAVGVLVMRSGIVKQATRRPLDVAEFRGFAISDAYAPTVFINGADAQAAQIFTLAHELAHLWIGASGISDVSLGELSANGGVEEFCNRVAGELLVPWAEIAGRWSDWHGPLEEWIPSIAREYHVSTVMVARQLLEHNELRPNEFFDFYDAEAAKWKLDKSKASGGNYYATMPVRNSRLLTESVLESMNSSVTTVRDASRLLGVKPANLSKLQDTLGAE